MADLADSGVLRPFSVWFKPPFDLGIYGCFWLAVALVMALRSVGSHALIGDNLTYPHALAVAIATCLLWSALLPQIVGWSDRLEGEQLSWHGTVLAHVGSAFAFVLVSVSWRFVLDLVFPMLRRVHGTPLTVFGIYLLTGLGRSLLVYGAAVAAAHAWKRYRTAAHSAETSHDHASMAAHEFPPADDNISDRLPERFAIKANGRLSFVRAADIDWIEAAGNYVSLHVGDKAYLLRESMRGIEKQLDSSCFLRVHRSAIVHLSRVRELQSLSSGRYDAIFISGARANLGRSGIERLKPAVMSVLKSKSA
jgi:hypothetical protein